MKNKEFLELMGLLVGVLGMRILGDSIASMHNGYLDIIPIVGMVILLVIGLRMIFNWKEEKPIPNAQSDT